MGLEILQAGVSFRTALKLQRDRQWDRRTMRLMLECCCFVCSWPEKRAGTQQQKQHEKALFVPVFKCHLLLDSCPPTVVCHTKAKLCYTLVKKKKGLLHKKSKLSVRCGRALCLVHFVETKRSLCLAFVFTYTVQAIIWYSF